MSWNFYPQEFSSYEEYVNYLKENNLAFDAPEKQVMEIPKTKEIKLCNAERFCEGLRLIAEECGISRIVYCGLGITTLEFEDGSSVGCLRAFREAGLIEKE